MNMFIVENIRKCHVLVSRTCRKCYFWCSYLKATVSAGTNVLLLVNNNIVTLNF